MFTRRSIMKSSLAAGATVAFAPIGLGHAAGNLTLTHFPSGLYGTFPPPVLISVDT